VFVVKFIYDGSTLYVTAKGGPTEHIAGAKRFSDKDEAERVMESYQRSAIWGEYGGHAVVPLKA